MSMAKEQVVTQLQQEVFNRRAQVFGRRRPAERLHETASVFFFSFGTHDTIAFFAVLHPRYFAHRFE